MAQSAAHIRNVLSAEERARLGNLTGDAGGAGTISFYGAAYGLPSAISGSNSHWLRGDGDPPPWTVIVLGFSRYAAEKAFKSCQHVGRLANSYRLENTAIGEYTDIFVCGNPRQPWPEFWKHPRGFG